jgi:hypothetical protein
VQFVFKVDCAMWHSKLWIWFFAKPTESPDSMAQIELGSRLIIGVVLFLLDPSRPTLSTLIVTLMPRLVVVVVAAVVGGQNFAGNAPNISSGTATAEATANSLGSKFRRNSDLLQLQNRSRVGTSTEISDGFRHFFFNLSLNLKFLNLNLNVFKNERDSEGFSDRPTRHASQWGGVIQSGRFTKRHKANLSENTGFYKSDSGDSGAQIHGIWAGTGILPEF